MLVESGGGNGSPDRIPDTLQALIAARIDHLPAAAKTLLQRGSVVGRVFWKGALEHLSPDVEDIEALLEDLQQREFVLREARSSISGEHAYRFKHLLIREVAYAGLAKLARAQYHARFAEWLADRTGEELLEIRAYHLDQAVEFLTELEGAPPEELAQETGAALVKAAKRAIAREAYPTARRLGTSRARAPPDARGTLRRGACGLALAGLVRGRGRDGEGSRPGARAGRAGHRGACAHRPRGGEAQTPWRLHGSEDDRRRGSRAPRGQGRPGRATSTRSPCGRTQPAGSERSRTRFTSWSGRTSSRSMPAARISRRSRRRSWRRRTSSGSSSTRPSFS